MEQYGAAGDVATVDSEAERVSDVLERADL
jgi:hypothetical protein